MMIIDDSITGCSDIVDNDGSLFSKWCIHPLHLFNNTAPYSLRLEICSGRGYEYQVIALDGGSKDWGFG